MDEFEVVDTGSLVEWASNPRKNDQAVPIVARSIRRFGFLAPIVARREDRRVLAGHTRLKAARLLALPTVPVRWVSLTDAEAAAYTVADNKTGEAAEWNDPELARILRELEQDPSPFDLHDLGFSDEELGALLAEPTEVRGHTRTPIPASLPHTTHERAQLLQGDCLHVLRQLPDASIDSVVTDPPYGLSGAPPIVEVLTAWLAGGTYDPGRPGFMGEAWDSFVPGPAVWREVWRVLKPGGHLIAFAGTVTADLMGVAIRLGGFEVRDLGEWLYPTGFPKSQNAAFLVDKKRNDRAEILAVCAALREAVKAAGRTNANVDALFGTNGMAGHWLSVGNQPVIPTPDQWARLWAWLGVEPTPDTAERFARLTARKGTLGEAILDRPVLGASTMTDTSKGLGVMFAHSGRGTRKVVVTGASEQSAAWEGWGTALLPAHEPYLIARKPFELHEHTLADNLRKWGTGALNIEACRVPPGDPRWPWPRKEGDRARWPANLIAALKPSQREKQAGCEAIPPVTGAEATKRREGSKGLYSPRAGAGRTRHGASLHNDHKTVKPLRLMAPLVRLVTPPGGIVLDPFMGSGTTGAAAIAQGFGFVGIDLSERNVAIAGCRIAHWSRVGLGELIGLTDTGEENVIEEDEEPAP